MTPQQIATLQDNINSLVQMLVADVYGQGTPAYDQAMQAYTNFATAVRQNPQAQAQLDEAEANNDSMVNE